MMCFVRIMDFMSSLPDFRNESRYHIKAGGSQCPSRRKDTILSDSKRKERVVAFPMLKNRWKAIVLSFPSLPKGKLMILSTILDERRNPLFVIIDVMHSHIPQNSIT